MRYAPLAVLIFLVVVIGTPFAAIANRSGPQAGHTGAPEFAGRDCTNCHRGTANSGPNGIAITVPSATFVPGSVIPVTVGVTGSPQSIVNGFQAAAYTSASPNAQAGWTVPNSTMRILSNNVSHALSGSTRSSWTTYYQTPTASTTLTIYAAVIDANGNGRDSGDQCYKSSVAMAPGAVPLSMKAVPATGTTLAIDLHSPSDANKPYVLAASFSNAGIPAGASRRIPLFPDPIFAITVGNQLPSLFQRYSGVLDANGRASAGLRIFNNPSLVGITLHHAFIVPEAGQPNGIGTISNPLAVTIF